MRLSRTAAILGILGCAALAASSPGTANAAHAPPPGRPGVSVAPEEAAAGTVIQVRGSAWAPGGTVQIQVCGADAVHGSADCDNERGVTAMVAPAGTFEAGLSVGAPPVACPCVVQVVPAAGRSAGTGTVNVPFRVLGHQVGAVLKDITPVRADVVSVETTGGGGWGELFGGRPRRTLVLQIRNAGAEPIANAPLVVGWGAGNTPDSPVDAPATGTLASGKTATYRVPVELPPASFGHFVVGGRYAGAVPFETSFTAYPWGLLGVNSAAALLFLLGLRLAVGRWAARRRRRLTPALVPQPHDVTAPPAGAVTVEELLDHLDAVARDPSGTYVIDRDELVAYVRSRNAGPIDVAALERFLGLDRFTPSSPGPNGEA